MTSPGRYSSGASDSVSLAGGGGTSLLTLGEGSEGDASGDRTADCASAISSSAGEVPSPSDSKLPSESSILNGSGTSGSITCGGGLRGSGPSPLSSGNGCSCEGRSMGEGDSSWDGGKAMDWAEE